MRINCSSRSVRTLLLSSLIIAAASWAIPSHAQGTTPQLLNISTRAFIRPDENVLIGGFIISGTVPKRVIIRAVGPSLNNSGLPRFLPDPVLELMDASGAVIATNDDWMEASNADEIRATTIAPSNDLESALLVTLAPGQGYTAIVRDFFDGEIGHALVEVYDLNESAAALLANISSRALVDIGDSILIGGFILRGGSGSGDVVVRAIGFSLGQAGVTSPLDDPTLELRNANGALVAANDDWQDTDEAGIRQTGLAPTDELESAIAISLPAGNYTALVAGFEGMAGIGLVEVYNLR